MSRNLRRRKAPSSTEELLVGVDGGATEVKVHEILRLEREEGLRLDLGSSSSSMLYDRTQRFVPVPMAQQLLEEERGELLLGAQERAEGRLVLEAFLHAIRSVAEQAGIKRLRVGICLPGVKSADGRGVVVMRNGPRLPDFLAQLEAGLAVVGLELVGPIPRLVSDGEACAQGENLGLEGLLAQVRNAYYIGGGTGIAEAFKLGGAVVDMEALRPWMRKAWQMETSSGVSLEDLASAHGMNERYAQRRGVELVPGEEIYPEERVELGDPDAQSVLREAGGALAQLVFARIQTCARAQKLQRAGPRAGRASFKLEAGTLLERVVVGQQLGRLLADPALARHLREPLEEQLGALLRGTCDPALEKAYLAGDTLRPEFLQPSLLRAAPAIGAAALCLGPARLRGGAAEASGGGPARPRAEESLG
ncbi:MAG: ROK family protein [Planctomycetes bacterium]|nr:ROK family protein [Planctomycetota bacterium]